MMLALLLFAVGMMLSAFFSGSETGFYRLNRARLLINALDGDWISRGLLWAANNPSVFVATALVGNNVANYLTSAAIVMGAGATMARWPSAEIIAPVLLAPVIFVYGELLPKNVFLAAPNLMLRRCGIPFGVAAVLFAPVSFLLWLFNKLIEIIGRKSPKEWQMVLARRELGELLDEGHAVGLLLPTQQSIAQATLALGAQPVSTFTEAAARFPRVNTAMTPADVALIAKRATRPLLPVEEVVDGARTIAGYVRQADCLLATSSSLPTRPILSLNEKQSYLAALAHMLAADSPIARVTNRKQQTVGYVTLARMQEALLEQ